MAQDLSRNPMKVPRLPVEPNDRDDAPRLIRVIHSMAPSGGGPSESVRQFSAALSGRGIVTEVASLDDPKSSKDFGVQRGYKLHALGPGAGGYGYARRLIPWLKENVRSSDRVVIQGVWNYHSWATWRALDLMRREQGLPFHYWVYPHGMLDPWFKRSFPLKHLKKCLYWRLCEGRVVRDASGVIFTSQEECERARGAFRPYRCREFVIPHGIQRFQGDGNEVKHKFLQACKNPEGRKILLYLGRLHPKKAPDLLIRAFAEICRRQGDAVSDWHLVMAGSASGVGIDEGYLRKLQDLAISLCPPESVTFTGLLQGPLKWGAFHACSAFVLPSHQENFGISVAEALSCGKPVLISDKVNIWREIAASKAGLVGADTLEGIVGLLSAWVQQTTEERAVAGRNAIECFEDNFEINLAASRLASLLFPDQDSEL